MVGLPNVASPALGRCTPELNRRRPRRRNAEGEVNFVYASPPIVMRSALVASAAHGLHHRRGALREHDVSATTALPVERGDKALPLSSANPEIRRSGPLPCTVNGTVNYTDPARENPSSSHATHPYALHHNPEPYGLPLWIVVHPTRSGPRLSA